MYLKQVGITIYSKCTLFHINYIHNDLIVSLMFIICAVEKRSLCFFLLHKVSHTQPCVKKRFSTLSWQYTASNTEYSRNCKTDSAQTHFPASWNAATVSILIVNRETGMQWRANALFLSQDQLILLKAIKSTSIICDQLNHVKGFWPYSSKNESCEALLAVIRRTVMKAICTFYREPGNALWLLCLEMCWQHFLLAPFWVRILHFNSFDAVVSFCCCLFIKKQIKKKTFVAKCLVHCLINSRLLLKLRY